MCLFLLTISLVTFVLTAYQLGTAFKSQSLLVRILILILVWTIVPKMEEKVSHQILSLQVILMTCKIHYCIH